MEYIILTIVLLIAGWFEMRHEEVRIGLQKQPYGPEIPDFELLNKEMENDNTLWHRYRAIYIIALWFGILHMYLGTEAMQERAVFAMTMVTIGVCLIMGGTRFFFITVLRNIRLDRDWWYSSPNKLDTILEGIEDRVQEKTGWTSEKIQAAVPLVLCLVGHVILISYTFWL